jgi:hypothetical protein
LQIAKAYLAGTDSGVATRTWQNALDVLAASKHGTNQRRWHSAANDKAFDLLRRLVIIETQGETLLRVLRTGTVSTNLYLRRLHNFCLDMSWLPWPIIPKRQWPEISFKEKRGITWEEHQKILAGESNPELRDYYELLWNLGGSQTDMASLRAEDIDWTNQTISYARMKSGSQAMIRFGKAVVRMLQSRRHLDGGFSLPLCFHSRSFNCGNNSSALSRMTCWPMRSASASRSSPRSTFSASASARQRRVNSVAP